VFHRGLWFEDFAASGMVTTTGVTPTGACYSPPSRVPTNTYPAPNVSRKVDRLTKALMACEAAGFR
jgi:hypothetical protein